MNPSQLSSFESTPSISLPPQQEHPSFESFLQRSELHVQDDKEFLIIFLVGLPANGKSFTAQRLQRFMQWQGYQTHIFNLGQYRRFLLPQLSNTATTAHTGSEHVLPALNPSDPKNISNIAHQPQTISNFFSPENSQAVSIRDQLAQLAMKHSFQYFTEDHGKVGIIDATNTSLKRRKMLRSIVQNWSIFPKVSILWIESRCDDENIQNDNIIKTKLFSPDYAHFSSNDEIIKDFRKRIEDYRSQYVSLSKNELIAAKKEFFLKFPSSTTPYNEGFIKIYDTGRSVEQFSISGYLPTRIYFFILNIQLHSAPIYLMNSDEVLHTLREYWRVHITNIKTRGYCQFLCTQHSTNILQNEQNSLSNDEFSRNIQSQDPHHNNTFDDSNIFTPCKACLSVAKNPPPQTYHIEQHPSHTISANDSITQNDLQSLGFSRGTAQTLHNNTNHPTFHSTTTFLDHLISTDSIQQLTDHPCCYIQPLSPSPDPNTSQGQQISNQFEPKISQPPSSQLLNQHTHLNNNIGSNNVTTTQVLHHTGTPQNSNCHSTHCIVSRISLQNFESPCTAHSSSSHAFDITSLPSISSIPKNCNSITPNYEHIYHKTSSPTRSFDLNNPSSLLSPHTILSPLNFGTNALPTDFSNPNIIPTDLSNPQLHTDNHKDTCDPTNILPTEPPAPRCIFCHIPAPSKSKTANCKSNKHSISTETTSEKNYFQTDLATIRHRYLIEKSLTDEEYRIMLHTKCFPLGYNDDGDITPIGQVYTNSVVQYLINECAHGEWGSADTAGLNEPDSSENTVINRNNSSIKPLSIWYAPLPGPKQIGNLIHKALIAQGETLGTQHHPTVNLNINTIYSTQNVVIPSDSTKAISNVLDFSSPIHRPINHHHLPQPSPHGNQHINSVSVDPSFSTTANSDLLSANLQALKTTRLINWRSLRPLSKGLLSGYTEDIMHFSHPRELDLYLKDKLNFRFPRGETFHDVLDRTERLIIELSRSQDPVLIVAPFSTLRCLVSYFFGVIDQAIIPHVVLPRYSIFKNKATAYNNVYNAYKLFNYNDATKTVQYYSYHTPSNTRLSFPYINNNISQPHILSSPTSITTSFSANPHPGVPIYAKFPKNIIFPETLDLPSPSQNITQPAATQNADCFNNGSQNLFVNHSLLEATKKTCGCWQGHPEIPQQENADEKNDFFVLTFCSCNSTNYLANLTHLENIDGKMSDDNKL